MSLRGDTIINKDCKIIQTHLHLLVRRDIHIGKYNTTPELFLSKVGV